MTDPAFVAVGADDYRLAGYSAAIDAGAPNWAATDIRGIARPKGAGYDISAYEFAGPLLDTPTYADVSATTATLGGNVTSTGGLTVTERGVYWSTTDGFAPPGAGARVSATGAWTAPGAFTVSVTGLAVATPIYFRAFAANANDIGFSAQGTFTTTAAECIATAGTWSGVFGSCPPDYKYIIPDGVSVTLDVDVAISGDLELQGSGALDAVSQGKTFTLDGDAAQTLTGSSLTFYRLAIDKTHISDTVTIAGHLGVTDMLSIARGKLITRQQLMVIAHCQFHIGHVLLEPAMARRFSVGHRHQAWPHAKVQQMGPAQRGTRKLPRH